jgi:hypothetical protein
VTRPAPNAAIAALEETLGAEATRDLVRLFLAEFAATIRTMSSAGREEQLRLAHGTKSSARHMGAEALCSRMAALEERLHGGGPPLGPDDLAGAMSDFGAVEHALRRYAG